jgi:endonuclease/exonuclease/phosphatase family metal-dependent hydrolase
VRLLSYNIRFGGTGREADIAAVVAGCAADLVVLQEASNPDVVQRVAERCGMPYFASRAGESVAFMSRLEIEHHAWYSPWPLRRAFLEIVPRGLSWCVFGVHLSAIHSNWTERRRVVELRTLLHGIRDHQHGPHVVVGDFNTLAPGEELDIAKLPYRFRAVVWVTGGRIRWQTIQLMLNAGYRDAWRSLHLEEPGYTFPTWDPHVRLDFAFVSAAGAPRVRSCEVRMEAPSARAASDHFPLLTDIDTAHIADAGPAAG